MKRLSERLAILENNKPALVRADESKVSLDFSDIIKEIEAKDARIKAMGPLEKIKYLTDDIAKRIARASGDPFESECSVPGLAEKLHALYDIDVKSNFPNERYEIRRCEIALLDAEGYDTREIKDAHQKLAPLPWQWNYYAKPLPTDAQEIINRLMLDA